MLASMPLLYVYIIFITNRIGFRFIFSIHNLSVVSNESYTVIGHSHLIPLDTSVRYTRSSILNDLLSSTIQIKAIVCTTVCYWWFKIVLGSSMSCYSLPKNTDRRIFLIRIAFDVAYVRCIDYLEGK